MTIIDDPVNPLELSDAQKWAMEEWFRQQKTPPFTIRHGYDWTKRFLGRCNAISGQSDQTREDQKKGSAVKKFKASIHIQICQMISRTFLAENEDEAMRLAHDAGHAASRKYLGKRQSLTGTIVEKLDCLPTKRR